MDAAPTLVHRFSMRRIESGCADRVVDTVAVEEPLEIRIQYFFKGSSSTESFAVTMRTPGHDRELAAGLLLTEGVVHDRNDLSDLRVLGHPPSNEILAQLAPGVDFESWRAARNGILSSSCGICGKRTSEAILQDLPKQPETDFRVPHTLILALPDLLLSNQRGFSQTGALHAAALISAAGEIEASFEDIGRHNALDKVIGWALLNDRLPVCDRILFMSSRSSFELIQKAAMAGAPVLATVGGPSSLAIETARQVGLTLAGFVRGHRFNLYSGEWRINSKVDEAAVSKQQSAAAPEQA